MSQRDIRAYYEGANGSRLRSVMPGFIREAKKDLSRSTRRELLRISRALWKNNPMCKAVIERLVTYVIGTGIRPEPDSSNPEWNRRAAAAWDRWTNYCELTSRLPLWKQQEIVFRSTIVDGDMPVVLTYGDSGRPRIQLIESDQCTTVGSTVASRDDDGVICDATGRASEYVFQEPIDNGVTRERRIPADSVVMFANIERADQKRGATLAAATLTTAVDLHDILTLEKAAVKDASSKTDIIKTADGEMPDGEHFTRDSETTGDDREVAAYYEQIFGPEAKVLKRGDEWNGYEPKRPGPAWTGFVDFLAELICLSYNLSPSLVRQIKVGGADTRRDLAIGQRVFEWWQLQQAWGWQRVYEYVIEFEINDGSLGGAPFDWRRTSWLFPRAATVDAGRQAQQDREDVRTGNMTLREQCGQYGTGWRDHIRQLAVEMKEVMTAEQQNGLPEGSLMNRLYGGPNAPVFNVQAQPDPNA